MDQTQLQTVLREAQMGSAVAFGQVYREFSVRVFGLCRKMLRSQAAAEDATSEVFERAFQSLETYDRERPFAPSPLVAFESKERRRALLGAIDALPESYRLPLILKYYGDLSYDEIAEHLGTTRNNVAVLLHRAKRDLRGRLETLRKEES